MKLPALTPDFITDPLEKLVGQLEKMVGAETTESKLKSWGWIDDAGRPIEWRRHKLWRQD